MADVLSAPDYPFMTNMSKAEILDAVPTELDLVDLSGYELLVWAEGNLPKVFAIHRTLGKLLSKEVLEICSQQVAAAHEQGALQEEATYFNTRGMLRSGVIRQELDRTT